MPDSKLDTHWVMEQELSILDQAMDGTGAVFTGMAVIGNAVIDTTMETAGTGLQTVGSAFAIGGSSGKKKRGKHGLDASLTDSTIMSHAGSVQWSGELNTGRGAN